MPSSTLLKSASSLLKVAVGSIGQDGVVMFAELSDVGEVVRLAGAQIAEWLSTVRGDMEPDPAFDVLDACTAINALLEAGIDPRNGKTISPVQGVLRLAIDRLEEFLGGEPNDDPDESQEVPAAA